MQLLIYMIDARSKISEKHASSGCFALYLPDARLLTLAFIELFSLHASKAEKNTVEKQFI